MVFRLCTPLNYPYLPARIVRCFGDDLQEQVFSDMVRAGAGDQVAAGVKELQAAQIDFLVAAAGGGDAGAILCESRRVQNNHVEVAASFVVLLQDVERIGLAEREVGDVVQLLIAAGHFDGCGREIHRLDLLAVRREGEREAAIVREAVEHRAAGIGRGGGAVFALIQEAARLLPLE